jgi:hypothetical protein
MSMTKEYWLQTAGMALERPGKKRPYGRGTLHVTERNDAAVN